MTLTWDRLKVRLFLDLAWNGKLSQQLNSVILYPPGLLPVPNRWLHLSYISFVHSTLLPWTYVNLTFYVYCLLSSHPPPTWNLSSDNVSRDWENVFAHGRCSIITTWINKWIKKPGLGNICYFLHFPNENLPVSHEGKSLTPMEAQGVEHVGGSPGPCGGQGKQVSAQGGSSISSWLGSKNSSSCSASGTGELLFIRVYRSSRTKDQSLQRVSSTRVGCLLAATGLSLTETGTQD